MSMPCYETSISLAASATLNRGAQAAPKEATSCPHMVAGNDKTELSDPDRSSRCVQSAACAKRLQIVFLPGAIHCQTLHENHPTR
jgi:hypothetical protein